MPGPSDGERKYAVIGLGGNLGDPEAAFVRVLRDLAEAYILQVAAVSSLWRTPPWGEPNQPDFLNACALVTTGLGPHALLDGLLAAERREGRVRADRWGPRTIDLDIILYGDEPVEGEGLTIPHPRFTERAFVLVPLAEIVPKWPIAGETVADLAAASDHTGLARMKPAEEWWQGAASGSNPS